MTTQPFENKDYWRAIILYGQNASTYKIALGQSLVDFVKDDKTVVTINELAEKFFDLFRNRLKNEMPQLNQPNRMAVMERVINSYNLGKISKTQAIEIVAKDAFNDVIPRFHTVNNEPLPVKFYRFDNNKLFLSDNVFEIFTNSMNEKVEHELHSRWDLLEAAFVIQRENYTLINDIRKFYIEKGYDRTNITKTRPVLNGYQSDICFYCGEIMQEDDVHVDHVIPRQLIYHDDIWNLVLSHSFCNSQKSDALPNISYIAKLIERNEHFIESNHPIKRKLIHQLGRTKNQRKSFILNTYEDAKKVIGYTWDGIRGYNPDTDEFYKTFIRMYINR